MNANKTIAKIKKEINDPDFQISGSCEWSFWPFTVKITLIALRGKKAVMALSYTTNVFWDTKANRAIQAIATAHELQSIMGVQITDPIIDAARDLMIGQQINARYGMTRDQYLKMLADPAHKLTKKDKMIVKLMEEQMEE